MKKISFFREIKTLISLSKSKSKQQGKYFLQTICTGVYTRENVKKESS